MLIHTVVSGENLREIAEAYGTSTRELLHLNELQSDMVIVPGQHLLIPGPATLVEPYRLRRGDTLATVARRAGVPQANLERWLGVGSTAAGASTTADGVAADGTTPTGAGGAVAGTAAPSAGGAQPASALPGSATSLSWNEGSYIPIPKRITQKRAIEVNGYITPDGTASDARRVREVSDRMTYVSVFSYQAKPDGTLTPQPDTEALSAAKKGRVAPLMTVTNFDGTNFNTELAHTLMANTSLRRKLIQNIVNTAKQRGYRGVNVDFEHMRPTDRQLYNEFVRDLASACRAQRLSISIAMGPKTSDAPSGSWMGAFDYKTLGEEVDFLMLMTYEWGWVGGPPMAGIQQHSVLCEIPR